MYFPMTSIFKDYNQLRDELYRVLDENRWRIASHDQQYPSVNIEETKDGAFEITLPVPGTNSNHVDITLKEGKLIVSGERPADTPEQATQIRGERRFGKFYREIALPTKINEDSISATYKDGILHIHADRAPETKPRKISVA
jgi:HSP20 family protein